MNLILFGFKGCGKTTFGKKIAHLLHRPFIDTDDLVCTLYAKEKKSAKQINQEIGLTLFRALEKQAIFSLQSIEDSIIALGGGAVLDCDNVAFLQKLGALVYLKADAKILCDRMKKLGDQGDVPSFLDPKHWERSFWTMIQERTPIYESIPASKVDTNALDEAGVLAALKSVLLLEDRPNGL